MRQLDNYEVDCLKRRAALNNRSLEGEVRHILKNTADKDMEIEVKRTFFLETTRLFREKTRGREHTPAEVLILKDRDGSHRDDF